MEIKYRRVYYMLKNHGHDAAKVLEIIFDAKRKDKHALRWIKTLRQCR